MSTTELTKFDLKKAIQVAQELDLKGVLEQLTKRRSDPTTMQEFLSCFTQKSAEEEFLERYTK